MPARRLGSSGPSLLGSRLLSGAQSLAHLGLPPLPPGRAGCPAQCPERLTPESLACLHTSALPARGQVTESHRAGDPEAAQKQEGQMRPEGEGPLDGQFLDSAPVVSALPEGQGAALYPGRFQAETALPRWVWPAGYLRPPGSSAEQAQPRCPALTPTPTLTPAPTLTPSPRFCPGSPGLWSRSSKRYEGPRGGSRGKGQAVQGSVPHGLVT